MGGTIGRPVASTPYVCPNGRSIGGGTYNLYVRVSGIIKLFDYRFLDLDSPCRAERVVVVVKILLHSYTHASSRETVDGSDAAHATTRYDTPY
jgi:hypothetical protein